MTTQQAEAERIQRTARVVGTVIAAILVTASYIGDFIPHQFVLRHTSLAVQLVLTSVSVLPVPIGIYFLYAHATGRNPRVPKFLPSWYRKGFENHIGQMVIDDPLLDLPVQATQVLAGARCELDPPVRSLTPGQARA